MIHKRLALSVVAIVILTSIVVYSADAAGIPKKAISTVSRFIESDLPTTTLFTDVQHTITAIQQFSTTAAVFENPAQTFGTTLAGGAVGANRTLNLPAITGTDTLGALGMTQTWTATQTINSLTLGGDMNVGSNALTTSGHKGTLPANTGTFLYTNSSGSSLTNIVTSATGTANNVTVSASTGAVTWNLGSNVVTTGGSTQRFSKNLDLGGTSSNSDTFDNSGMIIRNPAHSFAYTVSGSAITANRTLTLPLTTQTETLAVQPAINFTSPAAPATVNTFTRVNSNLLATITPTVTGRVEITISGFTSHSAASSMCSTDIRIGTTFPQQGVAVTGTLLGVAVNGSSAGANGKVPFVKTVQATGLATGTKEFIWIGKQIGVAGTCTWAGLNVAVKEL